MAEAGGGGRAGYMDMLGVGEEAMADYFLCLSPSPSSAAVSTTTSASTHAAASPTCASYLPPPSAGPYHHILSFSGRPEQQQYHGRDIFGAFQYYGAGVGQAVPAVAVPQKSSPTTECSSSVSSMSSSPTATVVSAVSTPKVRLIYNLCRRKFLDDRSFLCIAEWRLIEIEHFQVNMFVCFF